MNDKQECGSADMSATRGHLCWGGGEERAAQVWLLLHVESWRGGKLREESVAGTSYCLTFTSSPSSFSFSLLLEVNTPPSYDLPRSDHLSTPCFLFHHPPSFQSEGARSRIVRCEESLLEEKREEEEGEERSAPPLCSPTAPLLKLPFLLKLPLSSSLLHITFSLGMI